MSSISSLGLSGPVNLLLAFVVVLVLIGVIAWVVRRIAKQRLGSAARTRQPRLAVLDTAVVDARRQLVIIRRDNVEHLLMIGGGSDLVIETNIVRAGAATAGRDNAARTPGVLDAPRTSPVYEGTSWPGPQTEASVRLQRTYPIEEPTQWPASVQPEPTLRADRLAAGQESIPPQPTRQEPSLRAHRSTAQEPQIFPSSSREPLIRPQAGPGPASPPLRATPAERPAAAPVGMDAAGTPAARLESAQAPTAQPAAPPMNVAARLASRLDVPQRSAPAVSQMPSPAFTKAPVPPVAPGPEEAGASLPPERESVEPQPTSPDSRPKPAAGPRFSFPNLKFDRSSPGRTVPPPLKSDRQAARPAPSTAPPERGQAKPKSRTLYESLEQEMASLLGKPPGKS